MEILEFVKNQKKAMLKRNIRQYLRKNFDWKVAKAAATNSPLDEASIAFRDRVVAKYESRVAKVDQATTLEDIGKVPLRFL